jgi:hypothetical protein
MKQFPNVLVMGSPGGGKSVAAARDACQFPGGMFVYDPHKDSLARLILEHIEGNVLFDNFSSLKYTLGYELLKPAPGTREEQLARNPRRAQMFTDIMMRHRGGEIATMPLVQEWVTGLLTMYLFQSKRKPVWMLPYGFQPGTDEFRWLVDGCTIPELRRKFLQLVGLRPRTLRSEVGAPERLVNAVFKSQHFLARCEKGIDLGRFFQNKGRLIAEKGDEIDDEAATSLAGAINLFLIDHVKSRPKPDPPIRVYLDEATNAKTAGKNEEKAAGETRKYALSWYVMCQHPNFPGGTDGYFTNFTRKEMFRTADHDLAKKMAGIIASEHPSGNSRADRVASITTSIMTLKPGWRLVTGPGSTGQPEYVPMLENKWPDWPGLRDARFEEKLQCIYSRTEYQKTVEPPSESFLQTETPPSGRSPKSGSPAERLKRLGKKPTDGSAKNENESGSE